MTSYLRRNYFSCLRAAAAALFVLLFTSLNVFAQSNAKKEFVIEAGDAASTLKEFAQQSGAELLYSADVVEGVRTHAVKGEFTPKDALEIMVADTPLVVSQGRNSGGLAIRRATEAEAKNVNRAIAESSKSGRPEKKSDLTENENGEKVVKLDTFEVFGRKTLNMDIQRTRDDIQPYVTFSSDDIARSGALTLEDFLKSRLSMSTNQLTMEQQGSIGVAAGDTYSGTIDLRGLGTNQTLILVDGRRLPNTAPFSSGNFGQPSLSGIPMASVERIEVLPVTAGAIYGGGATGGVINVIRKRNYIGLDVATGYANTFDTDTGTKLVNVSGGLSLNNGRTHIAFSTSYSDANALMIADRDFTSRARKLLASNRVSSLATLRSAPAGGGTNIGRAVATSATTGRLEAGPLTLDNGQVLFGPITYVPKGYAGPTSDGGTTFANLAGQYNLDAPRVPQFLLQQPTKSSFTIDLRQEISTRLQIYVSASGSRIASVSTGGAGTFTRFFSADDPINPFKEPVLVTIVPPGSENWGLSQMKTDSLQIVGGAILRLQRDWTIGVDYQWSRSRFASQYHAGDLLSAEGQAALAPYAFQDLAKVPLNLAPYLDTAMNAFTNARVNTKVISLRTGGPTIALPAGNLNLSILAEHLVQDAPDSYGYSPVFPTIAATLYPHRSQITNSGYAELQVPLLSAKQKISFVESLDLQLSLRSDRYESGSAVQSVSGPNLGGPFPAINRVSSKWTSSSKLAGLRYGPTKDISFRASFGTGFLPPNLIALVPQPPNPNNTTSVLDPRRGNSAVPVPYTTLSGGNPSLQPETSKSTSVGIIFTPKFLNGFRLTIDYSQIRKAGEINTFPSRDFIINNETVYPTRVVRGPNLPGDQPGWAGPVTALDLSAINLFFTSVKTVDFNAEYSWSVKEIGKFRIAALGTQFREFVQQADVTTLPLNSVGHSGGPLRWRGNIDLRWERGPWYVGWNVQYYDKYAVAPATASPATAAAQAITQGSDRIPSQNYHDLFVQYRFGRSLRSWTNNLTLSAGIQNVFNTSPPIVVPSSLNTLTSTYSYYGDPRLRRFTITVQKGFGR